MCMGLTISPLGFWAFNCSVAKPTAAGCKVDIQVLAALGHCSLSVNPVRWWCRCCLKGLGIVCSLLLSFFLVIFLKMVHFWFLTHCISWSHFYIATSHVCSIFLIIFHSCLQKEACVSNVAHATGQQQKETGVMTAWKSKATYYLAI